MTHPLRTTGGKIGKKGDDLFIYLIKSLLLIQFFIIYVTINLQSSL